MSSESSTEAASPEAWQAFVTKPGEDTAKAVAEELGEDESPGVVGSIRLMAKTLAQRSANERSAMSRLIAAQLMGDVASKEAARLRGLIDRAAK
ncbi:hypothetical protein [Microbispora triticiradicis]|nr:hypothetical protein [Microbispora triticiradicis]GLW23430.1 hypothetical protein Mame01_34730 [Microbispora amethystogenes]